MEDYKKKYEKALDNFKKIKAANKDNKELVDFIEYKYPELKESEDEKIRKALKEYFINSFQNNGVAAICGVHIKDILAWLEKQNKQNPIWSEKEKVRIDRIINVLDWAEEKGRISYSDWEDYVTYVKSLKPQSSQKPVWSEEDEHCIELLLPIIDSSSLIQKNRKKCKNFLNSLKDRVQLQSKQEWSEEDEEMFDAIIVDIQFTQKAHTHDDNQVVYEREIDWLKSLKKRYTWKPSEEQIRVLEYYMNVLNCNEHKEVLFGLYEQLKSL